MGHVLAQYLRAGVLYDVAAGRAACAQRKTSSKGEESTYSASHSFLCSFIQSHIHLSTQISIYSSSLRFINPFIRHTCVLPLGSGTYSHE